MVINLEERKKELRRMQELLLDLRSMNIGDKKKLYSQTQDMFENSIVEIYTLERQVDGFYLSYDKKNSFDGKSEFHFKEKAINIGSIKEQSIEDMNLTLEEKKLLKFNLLDPYIIKKNCNLIGTFENNLNFEYPNIIMVV